MGRRIGIREGDDDDDPCLHLRPIDCRFRQEGLSQRTGRLPPTWFLLPRERPLRPLVHYPNTKANSAVWRSGRQCRLDPWRTSCLLLPARLRWKRSIESSTEEAASDRYREVLAVTEEPVVSSDIIQQPQASIVDLSLTQVVDHDLVKIMSWYDNEWGYANQMVREALQLS